jgi:hypothetical protein
MAGDGKCSANIHGLWRLRPIIPVSNPNSLNARLTMLNIRINMSCMPVKAMICQAMLFLTLLQKWQLSLKQIFNTAVTCWGKIEVNLNACFSAFTILINHQLIEG